MKVRDLVALLEEIEELEIKQNRLERQSYYMHNKEEREEVEKRIEAILDTDV